MIRLWRAITGAADGIVTELSKPIETLRADLALRSLVVVTVTQSARNAGHEHGAGDRKRKALRKGAGGAG